LDGISDPVVEVTRLGDAAGILHLELLCYRPAAGAAAETAVNDVVATRLVFSGDETGGPRKDPDGHAIFLERAAHAL
jgi:hypothetical protein